jgi:hypothetical protein
LSNLNGKFGTIGLWQTGEFMSRDQTVFSELAVAYGIIDSLEGIKGLDLDSLQKYKREQLLRKVSKNEDLKDSEKKLIEAGKKIKKWLQETKKIKIPTLEWVAHSSPETGETVAQDLKVTNTNTRISIKENAELFQNPSPTQVFEFWPKGAKFTRARSDDWFITIANKELNDYFIACNGPQKTGQNTVKNYYENISGTQQINGTTVKKRKAFTQYVKELHTENNSVAKAAYQVFCDSVSKRSADCFNTNFKNTFIKNQYGSYDIHQLTNLISVFFKIDEDEHIIAGTEKNKSFAVVVQDINTWKKTYSVIYVAARALNAVQPEVLIEFSFRDNLSNSEYKYGIQSQIRWSHGKFCGNPESKLYRYGDWNYTELPWVSVL